MNADLNEGATDGKYTKVIRDRGGAVDPATALARKHLHPSFYGMTEVQPKVRGDGKIVSTPNYVG
jgi:hypothetical protein